jgi:ankyrin repeat protein
MRNKNLDHFLNRFLNPCLNLGRNRTLLSLLSGLLLLAAPASAEGPATRQTWSENDTIRELHASLQKDASQKALARYLLNAVYSNDLNAVKFLLAQGAHSLSIKDGTDSALVEAIYDFRPKIAALLLEQSVNLAEKDGMGKTLLFYACRNPNPDIARILVQKGAQVDVQDDDGETPLFIAASEGNSAMLEFLQEQKAPFDLTDKAGNNVLASAFSGGRSENIDYLLSRGVDPNHLNLNGEPAIFMLAYHDQPELIPRVSYQEYGYKADLLNKEGHSLLEVALLTGHYRSAKALISKGFYGDNPLHTDSQGQNAVSLLLQYVHGAVPADQRREIEQALKVDNFGPLERLCAAAAAISEQISALKANMHTLQTIVETYGVDHQGMYPKDLTELFAEADKGKYWKDFSNPFNGRQGFGESIRDYGSGATGLPDCGKVLYQPVVVKGKISKYYLYSVDQNGQLLKNKDHAFSLSNG